MLITLLTVQADQKTALESQKSQLENRLSEELIATKGKHSNTIAQLQERLDDTGG